MRRLLQLALDLVDHLLLHLLHAGAPGQIDLHHHHAEGEVRVFLLAHAQERKGTGGQQQHQQERGEAAVPDGPARQVEAVRRVRLGWSSGHSCIPLRQYGPRRSFATGVAR